ncbi:MAG: UDP-4-amino-4,6-dideoxy-N-acetyl-beta-L-altrosamine transaminase [Proteobacteria bacterium]|nr:UDP-4-amino-4,6-dideoxy-N-acetyl-beta-L-altrosamine transaminase [Pseudomonadota bacterium]
MIPYGRQDITQDDIDTVVDVLRSDYLTQGPKVPEFEKSIQDYCGVAHALAVNSATSALHVACLALNLGPGDEVWTSPITFVASANCARHCGANVEFVDIDPRTYNLSTEALEDKLKDRKNSGGTLPSIVIPVHFGGQSCDMVAIRALSDEFGFRIIEDASHAIGGRYRDKTIGSCRYSDITVFSFHPVKIVTTAEGGVATTENAALAQKMALLRNNGVTRDPALMTRPADGQWYYEQLVLGYNYRMTDIQAALGCSQMQRLDEKVSIRHQIANRYDAELAALPLVLPFREDFSYSAFHLYVVLLEEALASNRRAVFESLRERGIGVNVHYIPVHTQPYFRRLGFQTGDYPYAEDYYARALSIPLFPTLTREQQDEVIAALTSALS